MDAAIFARVSTTQQETDNQVRILQEVAERRGWTPAKVYRFQESAWKGQSRQYLREVFDDASRGLYGVLMVWALDRLSRGGALDTLQIVKVLSERGVQLFSYQEPWIEATGPMRELLISIAGWVGQMESQRRSERTRAGLARTNKKCGRPSVVKYVDSEWVMAKRKSGWGWQQVGSNHPRTVPTAAGGMKRPSVATIRRAMLDDTGGLSKTLSGETG